MNVGIRLMKKINGKPDEVYLNDHTVYKEGFGVVQLVKQNGICLGVIHNGTFVPLKFDARCSVIEDENGNPDIPSAYGERKGARTKYAFLVDFAGAGWG